MLLNSILTVSVHACFSRKNDFTTSLKRRVETAVHARLYICLYVLTAVLLLLYCCTRSKHTNKSKLLSHQVYHTYTAPTHPHSLIMPCCDVYHRHILLCAVGMHYGAYVHRLLTTCGESVHLAFMFCPHFTTDFIEGIIIIL